ncbi:hypothetical protein [Pseudomonas donghuensis]|uniref:hypothetical protein n=1 Tax=Pseudomonas donghuensis TaxID=1163398 RepID=UPI00216025B4|nr:hypothetical protein [Pseudomonas donghuensis]UVL22431.1 hypothetical protein LOY30_16345 [Pseudomonas donghuensis]
MKARTIIVCLVAALVLGIYIGTIAGALAGTQAEEQHQPPTGDQFDDGPVLARRLSANPVTARFIF